MTDAGAPDAARASDAGSTPRDASSDAQAPDAGVRVDGAVPLFIALGWGGRRVMSCDLGRTWIADQAIAPESEDDWHQPYTPKSLAYGGGTFVSLTGWGTNSVAHVSEDGVSWRSTELSTSYGGVGYDDGRFVLLGNRRVSESRDRGRTWQEISDAPVPSADRDDDVFEGMWVAGADGLAQRRIPGGGWATIESCVGPRHGAIGHFGGFVAGLGRVLSVGTDGDTCVVDRVTGEDLGAGHIGVGLETRPAFVGDAFWVVTGRRIHESTDGLTWSSRALPEGVDFDLVARAPSGTYVGLSGDDDRFYFSDDGVDWRRADGPAGNGLVRVVFGHGAASADCAAP